MVVMSTAQEEPKQHSILGPSWDWTGGNYNHVRLLMNDGEVNN